MVFSSLNGILLLWAIGSRISRSLNTRPTAPTPSRLSPEFCPACTELRLQERDVCVEGCREVQIRAHVALWSNWAKKVRDARCESKSAGFTAGEPLVLVTKEMDELVALLTCMAVLNQRDAFYMPGLYLSSRD
jgi:hypothetical protein